MEAQLHDQRRTVYNQIAYGEDEESNGYCSQLRERKDLSSITGHVQFGSPNRSKHNTHREAQTGSPFCPPSNCYHIGGLCYGKTTHPCGVLTA